MVDLITAESFRHKLFPFILLEKLFTETGKFWFLFNVPDLIFHLIKASNVLNVEMAFKGSECLKIYI